MKSDPAPELSRYMLFFRNTGPEVFKQLSGEQREKLVASWNVWFEGLLAQGKAEEGQPLEIETRIVSGPVGSRIIDGPYPEAKEAIGGYVSLLVSGLDEATAIAQQHPALAYGMFIEIRQLTPNCHELGVTTRPRAAATTP